VAPVLVGLTEESPAAQQSERISRARGGPHLLSATMIFWPALRNSSVMAYAITYCWRWVPCFADSICRSAAGLLLFSVSILRMGCNTPIACRSVHAANLAKRPDAARRRRRCDGASTGRQNDESRAMRPSSPFSRSARGANAWDCSAIPTCAS